MSIDGSEDPNSPRSRRLRCLALSALAIAEVVVRDELALVAMRRESEKRRTVVTLLSQLRLGLG